MKDCYLVLLEGQGDLEISLIGQTHWRWLTNKDQNPPEQLVNDYIEDCGSDFNTKDDTIRHIQGDGACWKNDRALCLGADKSIKTFRNLIDYTQFVVKNQIEILDEYRGFIY